MSNTQFCILIATLLSMNNLSKPFASLLTGAWLLLAIASLVGGYVR